jgi:signal peptidase I
VAVVGATAAAIFVTVLLVLSGQLALVVTHGVSMEPRYHKGDLVVVAKAGSYQIDDVVAYRIPAQRMVVLHRLIGEDADGYTFKGDNNESLDPWHPTSDQIVGRAVLHVPQGGAYLARATHPATIGLIAMALLAGGGTTYGRRRRRRRRKSGMAAHARRTRPGRPLVLARMSPTRRWAATITGMAAVFWAALATAAWTTPQTHSVTVTSHQDRIMDFSYTANVRPSAAYDGTIVRAPDPVFRQLTNVVTVQVRYSGPPGDLTVAGKLSSASGWNAQLPLHVAAGADSEAVRTVALDLEAIEAKAQAAAEATGVATFPLTIEVKPSVSSANVAPFAPALRLTLTPMQLTLAGGEESLKIVDTVDNTERFDQARELRLFDIAFEVAKLRVTSLIALCVFVLAAMVLALTGRRVCETDMATQVRWRYGVRVVDVAPLLPDQAPVDVRRIGDLVALSAEFAEPILHWFDNGDESFAVHHASVVYLHRITHARPLGDHG